MHFTRLRLNGFKSFVDPVDLPVGHGLSGVVGPNGCGKSNLLEAIRWVMGESRPSAMRSAGMEEIIFSGAGSRPARHFAEVTLIIDNSDRTAPVSVNDSDVVEVTRRITREAGSAYKVNGGDARAKDVHMLFADASTGANSPSLVRQGQISEIINAKPLARRRILEEAAGISGLYQRRHEAELKLNSTETNLGRVDDVLAQLQDVIKSLDKQARQASRYRKIGEGLRRAESLKLYGKWKEADAELFTAEEALSESTSGAAEAQKAASEAARIRAEKQEAVPRLREDEAKAAVVLQNLSLTRNRLNDREVESRKSIGALTSRIEQLAQDISREKNLNADAEVTIQRLEKERAELQENETSHAGKLEKASGKAREAALEAQRLQEELDRITEDTARLEAHQQSVNRMLEDARKMAEQSGEEESKARESLSEAEAELERSDGQYESGRKDQENAERASTDAEKKLGEIESALSEAQSEEASALAARSDAEGRANTLRAEVAALSKVVESESEESDRLIDQITVDSGYEAAVGAAFAEELGAPETDGDSGTGWVGFPEYADAQPLPEGASPLSKFVKAPASLDRRLSQTGLVDAADGPKIQELLERGQRVVSKEGDLWRWDGYRKSSEDEQSSTARRLRQVNQLGQLKRDLEEAAALEESAKESHELRLAELQKLGDEAKAARTSRRDADEALVEANRNLSRIEADRNIAAGKLESLKLSVSRHQEVAAQARDRAAEYETALSDLEDSASKKKSMEELKEQVERARQTMQDCRDEAEGIRKDGETRAGRITAITEEIEVWKSRLELAEKRLIEIEARKSQSESDLKAAEVAPQSIAMEKSGLAEKIESAEGVRKIASDALARAEGELREAEDKERTAEKAASEARELRARNEAVAEAAREKVSSAVDTMKSESGHAPEDLLGQLDIDPEKIPPIEEIEADIARLSRQRDSLGSVNLRAADDSEEKQSEYEALLQEKEDLEKAIRKLRKSISDLNAEGRARLLGAFEEVNKNFRDLFKKLFQGGDAKLELVEHDDPLNAGLEIFCQPPGKRLSSLSLMSGGEQTLTALSLLLGLFLVNPAPICVLDEVDAPLDDANVVRFCNLLDEIVKSAQTRFMIITHNAITMSRMNRLFGVTMVENGVSQLVSVDLKEAERLVA